MSTIYFFALLLGRDVPKGVLILFCMTVLIVITPFIIYDIGFLLSSSATVGLIFFPKCFNFKNRWIKETFIPTFTCTLFTLPVVIYFFQKVSVISILSNIVAVPIVQSTIYLGLLANIFKPMYFLVYIQLNIFRYIVEISSRIDLISITGNTNIFVYSLLLFLVIFCIYRYPIQNENYYIKKAKNIFK
jgi:competence protein ComEC